MAICVPNNIEILNNAEDIIYKFIKNNLNDNYILYHNYEIYGKEFDFLLIDKNSYIYLIEVKSWRAVDIVSIKNNKEIKYKDNNNNIKVINTNPLHQVRNYKFNLINKVYNKFKFRPKVVHLVCYPNIEKKFFYEKHLDIISEESCTILKDDFKTNEKFLSKLQCASSQYEFNYPKLTDDQIYSIRSMFEDIHYIRHSDISIKTEKNETYNEFFSEIENLNKVYSVLIYINSNSLYEIDKIYMKIIDLWKAGTKIHFISNDNNIIDQLVILLNINLEYLQSYDDFKIDNKSKSLFNFWTYYYIGNEIIENFIIIDGEYSFRKKELELIDSKTTFNLYQYKLEHFITDNNIIVKAGAGTGKTYSMISRITYLIYKHKYSPEEMVKKIYLITFTNDAAENMKNKLMSYFMNYYILTRDMQNLKILEFINKINISTIHSLSKKIVDKFSAQLGLGINSKIVNGTKEKNKLVTDIINEYMKENYENENVLDIFKFRTYELRDRIIALLDKIEQKNILLNEEYNFGENNDKFNKLIRTVIPKIQKQSLINSNSNNNVRLSQLIILIRQILENFKDIISESVKLDYLFIDEFQDTDDIQIELIDEFQTIIGFNLFVVGDIKQCIYRFRGAQDNAFDKLKEGNKKFCECNLVKNYRTDKSLIEKLDPIFSYWGEREDLKYAKEDKLVGIKSLNNNNFKDMEAIEFLDDSFENVFINKLKKERERLELLYNSNVNISKKEVTIAILVRTNYEVEEIKRICDEYNILIDAEVMGNLYDLESTRDLYILSIALKNNSDPKCLFNIFSTNYTLKKEDRSEMFNLKGNKVKLYEYFNIINPIDNWNKYIERLKFEPVMKVLREIIFKIEPWNIYAIKYDINERERRSLFYKRNLEKLLENIIRIYDNEYLTLNKLVDSLNINIYANLKSELRQSVIKTQDKSVNIVCKTIHKSKGLEYEVVLLPFANNNINDKKLKGTVDVIITNNNIGYSILEDSPFNDFNYKRIENSHYHDEYIAEFKHKFNEEVRIIYVALTRAISKIIYFKSNKIKKREEKRVQDLIEIKY